MRKLHTGYLPTLDSVFYAITNQFETHLMVSSRVVDSKVSRIAIQC